MSDDRVSSAKRGYGARWQKYRAGFLKKHPLCADHLKRGEIVVATVVDHIEPHRGDQVKFWDKANHQALCAGCHSSHKQRLEKSGREVGCDIAGVPLDAAHHWRKGWGG